ncbi:MAG: hypothetical protein KGS72_04620 [Cyanobacteria bacterium REEB67]|nr:hypothetical protein [Cyanobacteria bacterium REEB67]
MQNFSPLPEQTYKATKLAFDNDEGTLCGRIWTDGVLYFQVALESLGEGGATEGPAFFGWDWLEIDSVSSDSLLEILNRIGTERAQKTCPAKLSYKDRFYKGVVLSVDFSAVEGNPTEFSFQASAKLVQVRPLEQSCSVIDCTVSGQLSYRGVFFDYCDSLEALPGYSTGLIQRFPFLGSCAPTLWCGQHYYRIGKDPARSGKTGGQIA